MEQNNKPQSHTSQGSQIKKPVRRFYYHKRRPKQIPSELEQRSIKQVSFKKVSIVIPLFDEEESIFPLYQEIKKVLKNISSDYEVIFVDDGSNDKSLEHIKSLSKTDNHIRYISFRKNYGKSAALQIGFKYVTGDAVITMDADLQDDPNEIPNLLSKLEEGFDMVSGWKKKRFDPFVKKYSSRFFNFVTRLLTGIKIHDFNCGLKAYRRQVVQSINVYGELHRYIPVLANWKGFSVTEIVVKHHPRRYGKTKFGISRFFKGFVDLITVIFITRYIKRPMHLFGFFGFLSFVLGVIINAYLSYEWISGKPLYNRPLLFLGMLLIIVGVQFFAVGLLGEIMVHNSQSDKEYVIKEKK
ncbi:glycosyltransferase family 2 protein [Melioribacteraceae bacterium 4301-Me]|uniref:glycosyltransferase family 2 protein n=1 Tax=Pyranulibacter aquaticus TaxID=3163344 RepID=UPI0035975360